jgi:hypothetical protein
VGGLAAQPAFVCGVTTLAGSGAGAGSGGGAYADGVGTTSAFYHPRGLAVDEGDNIIIADRSNSAIRRATPLGVVTTIAGRVAAFVDGTGSNAAFANPTGVTVLSDGRIAVADTLNHRVRVISVAGAVTTLAGSGAASYADGIGVAAAFNQPSSVAQWSNGDLAVAEKENHRIRSVTLLGVVTSLAGAGIGASGYADMRGPGSDIQ